MEAGLHLPLGQPEAGRQGGDGLQIEVSPDKQPPVQLRLCAEKGGDEGCGLSGLQLLLRAVAVGETVLQLVEGGLRLAAAPLGRPLPPPPVQGQIPGQLGKKWIEYVGSMIFNILLTGELCLGLSGIKDSFRGMMIWI